MTLGLEGYLKGLKYKIEKYKWLKLSTGKLKFKAFIAEIEAV